MKSWKKLEQKVARLRGTERTPLSGGNGKLTRSDTLDKTFFIECKLRKDPAVWNLYEQVELLAKSENKIPVLVIKKKGKHGELFIVNDKYLKAFIENWISPPRYSDPEKIEGEESPFPPSHSEQSEEFPSPPSPEGEESPSPLRHSEWSEESPSLNHLISSKEAK